MNRHIAIYKWFLLGTILLSCFYAKTTAQQISADNLIDSADIAIEAGLLSKAEQYTLRAIDIAKQTKDEHSEAKYLVNLISIKIEQENSIPIDQWYDRSLYILERQNNEMELANLWNIKARHLMYNQKYAEASAYYEKAGKVYSAYQDDPVTAYYYNDMGYLEEALGNYQKAAEWYLKSIHIFELKKDKSGLANSLGNIANTYFNLNEPQKAIDYAKQSLYLRKETGDKEGIALVLGNITRMYYVLGQADSAAHYQKSYLQYARQSGKKKTLTDSYANLAIMNYNAKQLDLAIENIKNAIRFGKEMHHPNLANFYRICALFLGKTNQVTQMNAYYDSAFTLIAANNNMAQYRDYYATRMNYFKSVGDYKNAFENQELYAAYKDSILNESVKKQVAQLEIQYETQKKNLQIASEKAERAGQQLRYNIALSLLILGILAGIFFFYRYKFKKKLEQKNMLLNERNRISSELHDEVGSALSAINLISHNGVRTQHKDEQKLKQYLETIHNHSGQMMESISDIVWSMHPDNDKMDRIIARMKSFTAEILEAVDTAYHFHIDNTILNLTLNQEQRRDFYLIFKEIINNIAKYANATEVNISIDYQNQFLNLNIIDDGNGFDINSSTNGNGIRNIRRRIAKHNGKLSLESSKGDGTSIAVRLRYTS